MDSPDTDRLRSSFEGGASTVGIEEELMLLDPATFDLAPRASEVLEALAGDPRFKGELPAAQVELISDPCETVGEAAAQVLAARAALAPAASPLLPAVAAVGQALAVALAERHDAGEPLPIHPSWKITENRWSAARHGLAGSLADLESGEPAPTRERVLDLIESLAPTAEQFLAPPG